MNTYTFLLTIIRKNRYEYNDIKHKLDVFWTINSITEEQYKELSEMLVKPEIETAESESEDSEEQEEPKETKESGGETDVAK